LAFENPRLVGPIDAGKSFLLVVPGVTAMQARHLVRYFTARSNRRGKPRSEASGNPKIWLPRVASALDDQ
jgi:hypothetical protein